MHQAMRLKTRMCTLFKCFKSQCRGTEMCKVQHDRLSIKDRISATFNHVLIRLLPNTFTARGEYDAIA